MRGRSGFMLVTVMIITAVGLLFGAGALLMFRYQCQMRIDRQHELEKVYAVRSALNYIRTYTSEVDARGKPFGYHTCSERDLGLLVKPVEAIFPNLTNNAHFAMQRSGDFRFPCPKQYNSSRDYEYGVCAWTNLQIAASNPNYGDGKIYGLAFADVAATNGVKWWVNIGMRGTGGWLQEDYGRRYCFWPGTYVSGTVTQDIVRLCIIRNITNELNIAGSRHGWPLSKTGERAIVFEITPKGGGGTTNNADMTVYEYWHAGGSVHRKSLFPSYWENRPSLCNMGVQLADDKVSMFYIGNEDTNKTNDKTASDEAKGSSRGYTFSGTAQLTLETYRYFSEEVVIDGKRYGGVYTNAMDGKLYAPELRAVFEVEAASDSREVTSHPAAYNLDFLTDFKVTPAYQYDVFLEHPVGVTNLATVAQKIGKYARGGANYTILTYDTHGTEHKGFRRDEREQARRVGK